MSSIVATLDWDRLFGSVESLGTSQRPAGFFSSFSSIELADDWDDDDDDDVADDDE